MDPTAPNRLFREEALLAAAATRIEGDVLRLSPAWTRWTYWLLVAAFAVSLAYGCFGVIHEHAGGPAVVLTAGPRERCSAVAMLPGHLRPQIRPGMPLRVEMSGYRYAYQELLIDSVGAQVIGPGEAKRLLGEDIADVVKIDGPVVLVEATLPACSFDSGGQRLDFYHGMSATAGVRLRAERLLFALVPSLKGLFHGADSGSGG